MLYAFLMTALSLFAREDRVSNFEQLMRLPRIAETDMVSYPGGKCMLYRLYLRDKDLSHTPFSVSRPADFLSSRSIERRKRQNLPIDVTDLPVAPAYEQAVSDAGIEIVGKSKWNNTLLVRIHKEKELRKLDELDFITRKMKVFSAPDSVSQRIRSSVRKGLNDWAGGVGEYGAADAQIQSLNGKRMHAAGYLGRGMMIAVFDGGFMNVDKIPALHDIKLAGVRDFVVPQSKNVLPRWSMERWCFLPWLPTNPTDSWGWRLMLNICWCAVKMSAQRVWLKRITGLLPLNMLTVVAWISSIPRWAIMASMMRQPTIIIMSRMVILLLSPAPLRCVLTRESSVSILPETTEWEAGKNQFPCRCTQYPYRGKRERNGRECGFQCRGTYC